MRELLTVAKQMQARFKKTHIAYKIPATIFLTDSTKISNIEQVIARLSRETLVIIRDYHLAEREAYASKIVSLCKQHFIKVLIAGDISLALKLRANGIHISQSLVKKPFLWRNQRKHWIVTVGVHTIKDMKKMARWLPDAVLLSPIFSTSSHPEAKPLGYKYFIKASYKLKKPIFPLGGINSKTSRLLRQSKAPGLAAIDAFINE